MKKFFYLLVILLFGCSNADDAFFTKEGIPSIVTKDGIEVFIKKGAPFRTRSNNDAEYLTFYTKEMEDDFVLVNEQVHLDDGLVICKDYTDDAVLLATYTFIDDELIDIELSPEVLEPITQSSEWYNRQDGEKYGACVKRVYRMAKQLTLERFSAEVMCDFTSTLCPSMWAFTAIVGCAE